MGSLSITFKQIDGSERTIEDAAVGWSLMELARAHDIVGILADCGGACVCATCHVYVDPEWLGASGAPSTEEIDLLDMMTDVKQGNSRLACQIKLTSALDGLAVTVAPESQF